MTHNITKKLSIWAGIVAILLAVPLLLMKLHIKLYDPGSGYEEINWTLSDFILAGLLLLGAGSVYILATKNVSGRTQRIIIGIVVFIILAIIWVGAATGFGAE